MSRWVTAVLVDSSAGVPGPLAAMLRRTLGDLDERPAGPVFVLATTQDRGIETLATEHHATLLADPSAGSGTGGALRALLEQVSTSHVLVVNGDSHSGADIAAVAAAHEASGSDGTVVVANIADVSRSGYVTLGPGGEVLSFEPPRESLPMRGWAHAGISAFRAEALALCPPGVAVSLDRDLLPSLPLLGWQVRSYPLSHGFEDASGARFD